ncbi:hypothetical protein ACLKA6_001892 [Drosophila palustris]
MSSKKESSSSIRRKSSKQAPTRLPFHPRRSTRKPPPLELAAERFSTLPVDTDVLELATSPILEFDGLTGAVFRWPAVREEEAPPPPAKPLAQPPAANKKAQPPAKAMKRAAKPPVRPLTPTIIEVLDSYGLCLSRSI